MGIEYDRLQDAARALENARVQEATARDAANLHALALEVRVKELEAQLAALPEPPVVVHSWDFRNPTTPPGLFFTDPSRVYYIPSGAECRVETGHGRTEIGRKDERLAQVAKEPMGVTRIYRLKFRVPGAVAVNSNKVNLFQFWAMSGENPVLACELTGQRLRVVQKLSGTSWNRRTLIDIPFVWEGWWTAEVTAVWSSGLEGRLRVRLEAPGGSPLWTAEATPAEAATTYAGHPVEFKWGAYAPAYMANFEPEPRVGPEFRVEFEKVEVLEP